LQRKNEILKSTGRGGRLGHRVLATIKGREYSDATLMCLKLAVAPNSVKTARSFANTPAFRFPMP
jgi:hypothetical protein